MFVLFIGCIRLFPFILTKYYCVFGWRTPRYRGWNDRCPLWLNWIIRHGKMKKRLCINSWLMMFYWSIEVLLSQKMVQCKYCENWECYRKSWQMAFFHIVPKNCFDWKRSIIWSILALGSPKLAQCTYCENWRLLQEILKNGIFSYCPKKLCFDYNWSKLVENCADTIAWALKCILRGLACIKVETTNY